MKPALFALLVLLCACSSACSSEKPAIADQQAAKPAAPAPPSTEQARELIANSQELSEYQFTNAGFTTPVSGAAMSEPARQAVKELAAAGWLTVDTNGDVALTDKSRNDKRFLLRPNGLLDIVPLAKKEMGNVTAVRTNQDGTASADFTWRWIANEVGTALRTGLEHDRFATPQQSRATLMWDGTNWMVLKIE